MNKQQIFNELDYKDGDQIFVVRVRPKSSMQRITVGFNSLELFGVCEMIKTDLLYGLKENVEQKIHEITRIRIVEKDGK